MNASNPISHDKLKKRVTIQPIEGQKQFSKEFAICDAILGNHQVCSVLLRCHCFKAAVTWK